MNPTVSDRSTFGRVSGYKGRIVVSSVANSLSATSTSLPVIARMSEDFPGIGVSHERDRQFVFLPGAARLMLVPDRRQFLPEFFRAISIRRLSSSRLVSPALCHRLPALPLAAPPVSPQPRREIVQPRDLHLQPGRSRSRVPAENLNDDPVRSSTGTPAARSKVFQLGWRQITVHDDNLRLFVRAGWRLDGFVRLSSSGSSSTSESSALSFAAAFVLRPTKCRFDFPDPPVHRANRRVCLPRTAA